MLDYEIFGFKFSLVNSILLVILGFLVCSFTVCSCANMNKVLSYDYEYDLKKFIHKYL